MSAQGDKKEFKLCEALMDFIITISHLFNQYIPMTAQYLFDLIPFTEFSEKEAQL